MQNETIDGLLWEQMMLTASRYLTLRKGVVDALNVFPVPDGDTGTNMSLTVEAAAQSMKRATANHFGIKAEAMAQGALLGARGNSGVITSQILSGMAQACQSQETIDAVQLCQALEEGVQAAYSAVIKPVEGTILTVSRAAAEGARAALDQGERDLIGLLNQARKAAEETLAMTPTMLPILKQAGVVDAGGQGFLYLLDGFIACLKGEVVEGLEGEVVVVEPVLNSEDQIESLEIIDDHSGEIEFGYCTEFVVKSERAGINLDQVRDFLSTIGDCVLVVGNPGVCKVHVHTNHPGQALEYVTPMGTLHKMKIDNMREEAQKKVQEEAKRIGIISVAMGPGIEKILKSLGVHKLIAGGQTMNPSTQDFVEAIKELHAREVIILPNNSNIIMAAQQAAKVTDRIVHIVPTKTIPQGIGALMAFNEEENGAENARNMAEAAASIITLEVTYAVRDARYDEHDIRKGQILGLVNDKLTLTAEGPEEAVLRLFESQLGPEHELATIYYGESVAEAQAQKLLEELSQLYPEVEFEVYEGGQPLYHYIISIE